LKGKLTKLSQNVNALRTDDIEGEFENLPTIGEHFIIINDEPINPIASGRIVRTSKIEEIRSEKENQYEFDTENSTYLLEIYEKM